MTVGPDPRGPDPAEHTPERPSGGERSIRSEGDIGVAITGDIAVNMFFARRAPADETLGRLIDRLVQAVRGPRGSVEVALADKADLLAQRIYGRLRREEEQQRIWDRGPLPVRWRPASGEPAEANGAARLDLAGPLDAFEDVRRRAESGWLMVLGQAGSGKSILMVRFARELLDARRKAPADADKGPVPVIFSLGSWNPETSSLRDWMIDQLERDHLALADVGPDGSTWAAALVDADYVLPILDGFDEMAMSLRKSALRAFNASSLPLLVTSRRDELMGAVKKGDVAPAATGIELTHLTLDDVDHYLRPAAKTSLSDGTDTTAATGWEYVLNELRRHSRAPEPEADPACAHLTAVLTSPLMVTLARAVYESGGEPAELLELEKFSTRKDLEHHLLDKFVPTAYARFLNDRSRSAAEHRRWDPDRAQHWLGHLAADVRRLRTHDIEWWRLGTSMSLAARMLVIGVVVGVVSGLAVALVQGLTIGLVAGPTGWLREGVVEVPLNALGIGLTFGLMHGFATRLKAGSPVFEPSRMQIRLRGGTKKVRENFLPRVRGGLAGGLVFGVVFGLGLAVYAVLHGCRGLAVVLVFGNWLVAGIGLGLGVGLTLALGAGLEAVAVIEEERSVRPLKLLHTNRTTVLTQMLAVGLVIGVGFGITVWFFNGLVPGIASGLAAGITVGFGFCTLTAWGRWVVLVRVWLPLTGRLPSAVHAFLDDAHRRGVLRQVGPVYQFRHARLRDHLSQVHGGYDEAREGTEPVRGQEPGSGSASV
ncbi:NACHT domain-containing protein [Streptomyces ipomoeae]|uniref:NACHT domain-containing protein n=1 Tax=Streptomyces ipomoeae TaxID=103232 RepID=UPI001146C5AA|nr:NACHT domain-containing protein [Streptomyces ipomoeae]TQE38092.1 NACHT domain-containing protein [Streptomyces ipomoeae]